MRNYCVLVFLFFGIIIHAQKHDNIWLLGYGGGGQDSTFGITVLDFSGDSLSISRNEEILINMEGSNVAFCDKGGSLNYYSNGLFIADASFDIMLNGLDITEGPAPLSLPQGVLALPFPGNEDYSVLLNSEKGYIPGWGPEAIGLYYSIIDKTGNEGLGEVILKTEPLIIDTLGYGKLVATKHANGRDWWIIINESHTNRFYKILLDNTGIAVYDNQTIGMPNEEGLGQAVFSPNGNTYVIFNSINEQLGQFVEIYDFDRCTGFLTNHRRIQIDMNTSGGVAISPNSRFLYVSSYLHVYQFDLWANDIESTKDTVAIYDGYQSPVGTRFYLAQLAPDGKIYITCPNSVDVMHVIHNPNEQGMACNLEQHGVELLTYNSFSIPNFPNYRLGALEDSPCDTIIATNVVNNVEQEIEIKIFPNPASNMLNISINSNDVQQITLFSPIGDKVFKAKVDHLDKELNIDVSAFPKGVYFCSFFDNNHNLVDSKKVMVLP